VEEKLVGSTASDGRPDFSVAVEQYRKLAAALHHAQADRGLKAIIVTSANPGEGKSLTASNLALTLSESYQRRVLLVDGDLRRPSLHDIFGVPNRAGLSDGLARNSILEIAVREISPRLSILPSGPALEDPTGQLTSDQMRQFLDEARASYDWVIFDTPPIGLVSDAKLLAEIVDGVVLVVEAGKTGYPDLLRAVDTIGREHVLGVVLNRLPHEPGNTYYSSYYYQRQKTPKT
jgi:capsular exopolysaccharide synthesis family protein